MNEMYAGRRTFHIVALTVESEQSSPAKDMKVYPTLRHVRLATGEVDLTATAAAPFTASRAAWV